MESFQLCMCGLSNASSETDLTETLLQVPNDHASVVLTFSAYAMKMTVNFRSQSTEDLPGSAEQPATGPDSKGQWT